MPFRTRFSYVDLAEAFLNGSLSAEDFFARFDATFSSDETGWDETPYRYLDWFAKNLAGGKSHPQGADFWLKGALPAFASEMRHEPDELAFRSRFVQAFWNDGYFAPEDGGPSRALAHRDVFAERHSRIVVDKVSRDDPSWAPDEYYRAFEVSLKCGIPPLYWVHVVDPDNCFSAVSAVSARRQDEALLPRMKAFFQTPAAQGGASHLVLSTSDMRLLLVHEWGPDDFLVRLCAADERHVR